MLRAITEAATQALGFTPKIDLSFDQEVPEPILTVPGPVQAPIKTPEVPRPATRRKGLPVAHAVQTQNVYSWRHQFEDFIVGPSNRLAYVASQSFCHDAHTADQLFLCSAPGLGKTHLAQAIGSEIARQTNRSHVRVCYLSGEEFASQLVMAIQARTVEQFKARFRSNVDLLLLEDVHFFQGKGKMQDELLHTLKSLQNQGRRVVMTSSFLPKELADMDANLLSRFSQGFLAVIDKPDYETRLQIIENKSRAAQTVVPSKVAELLADRLRGDVRQLESCLKNIILRAKLMGAQISMDLAWEILQNYELDNPTLNLDQIISFICQAYGIAFDDLRSKSRKKDRVIARNTAFYLARKHTDLSLADIGRRFNRKHSTVIKGIASVEQEVARQSPLGSQIAHTIQQLHAH
ncbi:hypothetical protein MASR1M90_23370 [Desulfovibrionales bacterium]